MFLICNYLMSGDVGILIHVLICYLYILFDEISLHVLFCPFSHCIVRFFKKCCFEDCSYVLTMSSSSDMWLINTFSYFALSPFIFLVGLSQNKISNSDEVQFFCITVLLIILLMSSKNSFLSRHL